MSEFAQLSQVALTRQGTAYGPTYGSVVKGYPGDFIASAQGAVDGTTIISAGLGAYTTADDDLVGMLIEVRYAEKGAGPEHGAPLRRRVIEYDFATTALLIEALPFQVEADDCFWLLEEPSGYWYDDVGGVAVTVKDVDRLEVNDYWNGSAEAGGPYMATLRSTLIDEGTQGLITAYAQLLGAATVANMGANTTIGDLFEAMRWIEVTGGPVGFSQPRLDRGSLTGRTGLPHGVAGLPEISGQLGLKYRGPGAGRIGLATEIDDILGSVFSLTAAQANEAAAAGCTTASIDVGGAGVAGEMWLSRHGDVFMDTDGADPFVPSPSLRLAPALAEVLYGMRTWTEAEALNYLLKLWWWHGRGVVDEIPGLAPNALKLDWSLDKFLDVQLGLVGTSGKRIHLDADATAIARPSLLNCKVSTVTPRRGDMTRIVLGTTELEARKWTVDFGLNIALEEVSNLPDRRVPRIRMGQVSGTTDLFVDSSSKALIQQVRQGAEMRLLIQAGSTPGDPGVLALWCNQVEIMADDPIGADGDAVTIQLQWRVTRNSSSALPLWKLATA